MLFIDLEVNRFNNNKKKNKELKGLVSGRKKLMVETGRGLLFFLISFVELFDPSCIYTILMKTKTRKKLPK